jgi:tripartite-type tricarboxylate transporter receptor subunit TctC
MIWRDYHRRHTIHIESRHLAAAASITLLVGSGPVFAQSADAAKAYPARTVRFVNPSSPGGGADIIARILAQQLTKSLGQNFINDNRPGAANIIATEIVAKSPPDGYTLLIAATGTFVTNPLVYAKLSYSEKDFETISIVADAPFILTVHPSVPAKNLNELVALAKAHPGELTYASFGTGSSSHLAGELFQVMTKTRLLHVPYKGSAPGMTDLLAGNITMKFDSGFASVPYIQSKRIRALGVAALKRLPKIPDVPTLDALGLKDFEAGSWYGVMAPAGTLREIVAKLHGELVKALKLPEVQQRIVDLGAYPIGNTPEEFSAQIVRERERWAKVVKEAGIKPE